MKRLILALFSLSFLVLPLALGAQTLTPAAKKAQAMVKQGLAFWSANGKEKAIAMFNDTKGAFRDGEYYLFVFDYSSPQAATCIARGDGNKALIGKNMWAQKDSNGKLYIQDFVTVGKNPGFGWVDYTRTNPENKKVEAKTSYIENIPGTNIFIGCGFYKD